jgi:membrane protease YdiL (CAAX protease family)
MRVALTVPFFLLPSTALVFHFAARWLGREAGYLLGFAFYWVFWCLIVPLLVLRWEGFRTLLTDRVPLTSRANWLAAALLVVITLVTLVMYGRDFLSAPFVLILVALPLATVNGICEELLWRGVYVRTYPGNFWLAILFPAAAFALWHLVSQSIFPAENRLGFVLSTFLLGLAYGWIAYRTGSARWPAISHSLNGVLALSGMLAPSILKLFGR